MQKAEKAGRGSIIKEIDMLVNDLIEILMDLPEGAQVTVQTCRYDGTNEVYDDMNPVLLIGGSSVIICGDRDYQAKYAVCKWLSHMWRGSTIRDFLNHNHDSVIRVDGE